MIFDLDGTLVQTEKLKAQSYAEAAVALRPELTTEAVLDAFRDVVGLPRAEVATALLRRFALTAAAEARMAALGVATPWQAFLQVRLGFYETLLHTDGVLLAHRWPHTLALVERARAACDHIGLATMSHCREVRHVLTVLGLTETFDVVATRDDVERGKPDPEIYLLVAAQLDTPPAACLVIEDSVVGVRAAVAAGMHCIAVGTPFTAEALHRAAVLDDRWIVDDPADLFAVVDQLLTETKGAVR